MKEKIMRYLKESAGMTDLIAEHTYRELAAHADILAEFSQGITDEGFCWDSELSVEVDGWTAQRLRETTTLTPTGVYTYLVYLREEPVEAKEMLKRGLPRK